MQLDCVVRWMQSGKYPTVQWKKYRVSSLKIEKKGKASEALNGRILRGFLKIFLETNTLLPGHSLENCSHHSDCIVLNSQIIFHISVALRPEHSAYSIAQKRSCNRVNIFWLNRKTSWCHEQRTYVRHLGGKLCNYPVRSLSLSLSLSAARLSPSFRTEH